MSPIGESVCHSCSYVRPSDVRILRAIDGKGEGQKSEDCEVGMDCRDHFGLRVGSRGVSQILRGFGPHE